MGCTSTKQSRFPTNSIFATMSESPPPRKVQFIILSKLSRNKVHYSTNLKLIFEVPSEQEISGELE